MAVKIMAGLLLCLLSFAALAGCQDDSDSGQQEQAANAQGDYQAEVRGSDAGVETNAAPAVKVGQLSLPWPAPAGFARLEGEEAHLDYLRSGLNKRQILLAAFIRPRDAMTNQTADTQEIFGPEHYDTLLLTTLEHWQYTNFSAGGFDQVKTAWQEDSVPCTKAVLIHFEEAEAGSLAEFPAYTYNLGLAGYSPRQISFASVVKSSSTDGAARFVCTIRSLLYRQGKIIGLEYRQHLDNFSEIAPTVDDHLDYLEELQLLDGRPDSSQGGLTHETTRIIPDANPELSAVTRP